MHYGTGSRLSFAFLARDESQTAPLYHNSERLAPREAVGLPMVRVEHDRAPRPASKPLLLRSSWEPRPFSV